MTVTPRFSRRFASVNLFFLVSCFTLISVAAHTQSPQAVAGASSGNAHRSADASDNTLNSGFVNPPPSARLRCYWWWLNGHVTTESIDHDLTEMKAKGYGVVLLVDANGAKAEGNDPVPPCSTFGSPAWTALFLHAVETAHTASPLSPMKARQAWAITGTNPSG
jgi:hypothetical protein